MKRSIAIAALAVSLLIGIFARAADPKPKAKPPASAPTTAPVVVVDADGALLLKAEGARILGAKLHLQYRPVPTLVFWIDPQESVEWPRAVKKGKWRVEITYSCPPNAGGNFVVAAAASKVEGKAESTGDWQTFKTVKLGTITVANNDTAINLRSNGYINRALMNVRLVKLTPVAEDPKDKKK